MKHEKHILIYIKYEQFVTIYILIPQITHCAPLEKPVNNPLCPQTACRQTDKGSGLKPAYGDKLISHVYNAGYKDNII